MLHHTVVNLTCSESHCAHTFCEDHAFCKYFNAFSTGFDVRVVWKRLFVHILIGRHDVICRHRSRTP